MLQDAHQPTKHMDDPFAVTSARRDTLWHAGIAQFISHSNPINRDDCTHTHITYNRSDLVINSALELRFFMIDYCNRNRSHRIVRNQLLFLGADKYELHAHVLRRPSIRRRVIHVRARADGCLTLMTAPMTNASNRSSTFSCAHTRVNSNMYDTRRDHATLARPPQRQWHNISQRRSRVQLLL